MPYYNHVWIYALDNRRVNTCWFTELKHHRVEELYGIQWLLPRLQFHSWWGSSVFIQPRPKCIFVPSHTVASWLVWEPLVLAVSQLVQVGTAGKVDHGGWTAHQNLGEKNYLFTLFNKRCPYSPDCLQKGERGPSQSSLHWWSQNCTSIHLPV